MFDRQIGPRVLFLSVLNHLLSVVIAFCAGLAIAAPVSFAQMVLLIPPISLITLIPISIAGWGVREQSMQVAFSYAGLSAADGVTISLLFGAVYFIVGAVGGLAWLLELGEGGQGFGRDGGRGSDRSPDDRESGIGAASSLSARFIRATRHPASRAPPATWC